MMPKVKRRRQRQRGGIAPLAALVPGLMAVGKAAGLGAAGAAGGFGAKKVLKSLWKKKQYKKRATRRKK